MATKSKKAENLNALSAEELKSRIADASLRLNKLKFSHAITPIDNPLTIRAERRTIAKLQTALRTQQLGK
jgi:large subunit ribosomal protein L29